MVKKGLLPFFQGFPAMKTVIISFIWDFIALRTVVILSEDGLHEYDGRPHGNKLRTSLRKGL